MTTVDPEFKRRARRLWAEGKTIGEIAGILDCSIYDLSPWLLYELPEQAEEKGASDG